MTREMNPQLPHVSVVIPTHRRPEALARCLRSLIAQDYPPDRLDIHVVHNRTEDDTEAVVRRLAAESPVPLRYTARNGRGPAPSRHFGGMEAKGEIIAFVDDDCEVSPGWISAAAAAFAGAPEVGLVQGATLPNPAHRRRLLEKTVNVPGPSPFFETCNIFYRVAAFRAVDGFTGPFADRFYGEDTDLGRRVLAAGWQYRFSHEAVVYHEVTAQPLGKWLMECWHLRNLPLLVKRWPEMRGALFLHWFLTRQSAAFVLGLLGLVFMPLTGGWSGLAVLPFFFVRMLEPGRYRNPLAVAARAALGLPRACVTFAALVWGSARARCLVL